MVACTQKGLGANDVAGTIFVGNDVTFDVRTIDFEWIAQKLRSQITDSNRAALEMVLRPHDEQGMDMLFAHELDTDSFRQFASVIDDLVSQARSMHGETGMLRFLERVKAAVHDDPRSIGNPGL